MSQVTNLGGGSLDTLMHATIIYNLGVAIGVKK